jgi:hypothetical protein
LAKRKRQLAARKGWETRRDNLAMQKRHWEIEVPATQRMDKLLNYLLTNSAPVFLWWRPLGNCSHRLKHGVQFGTLVKFVNGGRTLRVLPNGYKRPQDFHPAFWEPLCGKGVQYVRLKAAS